jgi:hypothetical protein
MTLVIPSGSRRRSNHAANAGMHSFADRGLDHYPTPKLAAQALLIVEKPRGAIWEPAAGHGGIAMPLREAGYIVRAFDLADWGCPDCTVGVDFLTTTVAPAGVRTAIFNPPFKHAADFVRHALELVPTVISLGRLAFLESEARSDLIDNGPLDRVHIFKKRLPMMHRAGWEGPRATSSVCFAWFVFERDHRGKPTFDRI